MRPDISAGPIARRGSPENVDSLKPGSLSSYANRSFASRVHSAAPARPLPMALVILIVLVPERSPMSGIGVVAFGLRLSCHKGGGLAACKTVGDQIRHLGLQIA